MNGISRRRFFLGSAVAATTGFAGCSGNGNGGSDDDGMDETPTPTAGGPEADQRVADYLNAPPSADNFDGTVVDRTGTDEVAVTVGAQGNGGGFAFAPPALKISAGTTISWQWVDDDIVHNVVSRDESDFDFDSGDAKARPDPFEQSFDDPGVGLYFCIPHKSIGMKGGLVVVE